MSYQTAQIRLGGRESMDLVSTPADRARDLAQAKVDRETRRLDGENALAEYAAKRAALSDNISRLRLQRLAREAADSAGDATPATRPPAKKKKIRRVGVSR